MSVVTSFLWQALAMYLMASGILVASWLILVFVERRFDTKLRACINFVDSGSRYRCSICGRTWFLTDMRHDRHNDRKYVKYAMEFHKKLEHNL